MKILYLLFSAFAFVFSKLPFWLIYLKSDFFSFVLYYIVRYRRDVVLSNLRNAFPNKSEKEIKVIAKNFYNNLCDVFLEVIKIKGMSKKEIQKRICLKNPEVIEKLYLEGKSIMGVAAHIGNWEWLGVCALPLFTSYKILGIGKPLSNSFFQDYMTSIRTYFGMEIVHFKYTLKSLMKLKEEKVFVVIASDQTPTESEIEYRTKFLNQDTPVFLGVEKMSKMLDYIPVFINSHRKRRGYYEVEFVPLCDDPKKTKEFEITEKHVKQLEEYIIKNPDAWLWSHRRWKHSNDK